MTRRFDLRLYLVTDPELCAARGLVDTVVSAVRGGVTLVQLRNKTAPHAALAREAQALVAALAPFRAPLLVNDRIEVALAAGAAGAHIGQEDGDPAAARKALGPDAILGLSAQTEAQARAADPALVDYLGIGAVRLTPTKPTRKAPLGLDGAARVKRAGPLPAVAIGGVGRGLAGPLIAAGFDGVAVVRELCAADDPEAAARALRAEIDAARAPRNPAGPCAEPSEGDAR